MRNDRRSSYLQWDLDLGAALANETDLGLDTITAPEFIEGVVPFLEGKGRGGSFD
jgi:enoyl-CoA hydratase